MIYYLKVKNKSGKKICLNSNVYIWIRMED